MTGVELVTSVNLAYHQRYGTRLVSSFLEHVPSTVTLKVYHEASTERVDPARYGLSHPRLAAVDLHAVTGYPAFLAGAQRTVEKRIGMVPTDPDIRAKKKGYNYLWDAITFGKKAHAFIHAARNSKARWLFWVDADVVFRRSVPEELLPGLFKPGQSVVYFGRKGQHAETGFFGVDLEAARTDAFLGEYSAFWEKGRVFELKEGWTDSHTFDVAIQRAYQVNGFAAGNISTMPGGHVIAASPLGFYMDHQKGPRKQAGISPECKPVRYSRIAEEIKNLKAVNLLEVGTWCGDRAIDMLEASVGHTDEAVYHGFDLFEDMNSRKAEQELNVKRAFKMAEVETKIHQWVALHPGASFQLHKGDSARTLRNFVEGGARGSIDLAWIDGGHSIATILSDWTWCLQAVRPGGMILFDDYYSDAPDDFLDRFGCNRLVGALIAEGRFKPEVFPERDPVRGGGIVQIVKVDIR